MLVKSASSRIVTPATAANAPSAISQARVLRVVMSPLLRDSGSPARSVAGGGMAVQAVELAPPRIGGHGVHQGLVAPDAVDPHDVAIGGRDLDRLLEVLE